MFKFLLILFIFAPYIASAKYTICSITINSPDEIEIFKKHLHPNHFRFIELVPLSVESRPNNVHWFTSACQKDYSCDVLVISGHFGGLFFGESHNYILPVDIMEQMACSGSCPGLLSQLKEVYLFGCNTLAQKGGDQRTPEQYLEVLLDHHMARDMAETVVASRYLPFGLSFKDQMKMVFSGPTSIYGFSSLSPLGKQIRAPLGNYFYQINKSYGSYKAYLDQKQPHTYNSWIGSTIGGSVTETKGLSSGDPKFNSFQRICNLYDRNMSMADGMHIVKDLIEDGSGSMAYLAIKNFIAQNRPFHQKSLSLFNQIKSDIRFKNEFYPLYHQISLRLPYVRIQFLNFLNFFDWLPNDFYQQELRKNTLNILQAPTSEAYDFATALVYDEKISLNDLNLNSNNFSPSFYKNIWSALILDILNVQDYRAHRRLMNTCLSNIRKDTVLCYQILKTLGHLKVNDSLIINKMVEFLDIPHSGLIYYSIYGLAYSGVQKSSIHQSIARHFYHPDKWIQKQAIRAVGLLNSQDPQVNEELIQVIRVSTDPEIVYESLNSLKQMAPNTAIIREVIVKKKLHVYPDDKIKLLALSF